MKRILLIVLGNLHNIPSGLYKLNLYAKRSDEFSEIERYSHLRKIAKWIIDKGRINLTVYGKENLPKDNGFMIFPNHQGLFDGFAIVHAMERPFSTVYKKELDKIPFVNHICRSAKAIAIDRDDVRQGLEVINRVADEVKSGRNFMIFPEGTRSKQGNSLLEFKSGSFKSAIKAKCPIVPIAVINSYKVFDEKKLDNISVQIHILKPLYYEDYKDMKSVNIAEHVRNSIEKTINEFDK